MLGANVHIYGVQNIIHLKKWGCVRERTAAAVWVMRRQAVQSTELSQMTPVLLWLIASLLGMKRMKDLFCLFICWIYQATVTRWDVVSSKNDQLIGLLRAGQGRPAGGRFRLQSVSPKHLQSRVCWGWFCSHPWRNGTASTRDTPSQRSCITSAALGGDLCWTFTLEIFFTFFWADGSNLW